MNMDDNDYDMSKDGSMQDIGCLGMAVSALITICAIAILLGWRPW